MSRKVGEFALALARRGGTVLSEAVGQPALTEGIPWRAFHSCMSRTACFRPRCCGTLAQRMALLEGSPSLAPRHGARRFSSGPKQDVDASSDAPRRTRSTTYLRPVTWASVFITLGAAMVFYQTAFLNKKEQMLAKIPKQGAVGRAAVGGPFELVDTEGKTFTDKDLLGHFAILYFGFTFCPDICPDELDKITEGITLAEKAVPKVPVKPVFISIDPERDTPEVVKEYLQDFHSRFVGLTGTPEQVKKAARAYRVYYHKTNEEHGDYLVDHSIISYMIDPNGDFLTFFGKNNTAEDIAEVIKKNVMTWRKSNPNWRPGETTKTIQLSTGERQAPMRDDPE